MQKIAGLVFVLGLMLMSCQSEQINPSSNGSEGEGEGEGEGECISDSYRECGYLEIIVYNSCDEEERRIQCEHRCNPENHECYPPLVLKWRIAFTSIRDRDVEIYVMDADGTSVRRLTNIYGRNAGPSRSPDESKIAFTSNAIGSREIYVMDADGTNVRSLINLGRLISSPADAVGPTWSPDGSQIAFVSSGSRFDVYDEIYVFNIYSGSLTRLTYGNSPDWSPDGSRIAFTSTRGDRARGDRSHEIYVMDTDGNNQRRLTYNLNILNIDTGSSWSPDGSRIAFSSARDGNVEIYVMDVDGSNQRRLTNNSALDASPTWSPDGTKIAFYSDRDGNDEIYVMDVDGSNQINLSNNPADDSLPDWSP